jgi:hypothetical protein
MRPSKVRELARRYADNEIGFNDYRTERRGLIDRIVAGAEPLRERSAWRATLFRHLSRYSAAQALAAAGGVATLALAAIAWSLWPAAASHPGKDAVATQSSALAPGAQLLKAFVLANDWSNTNLAGLQAQWQTLSAAARAATRRTVWYRRLSAELENRINQQQALAPFDRSGKAKDRAARLEALAEALRR